MMENVKNEISVKIKCQNYQNQERWTSDENNVIYWSPSYVLLFSCNIASVTTFVKGSVFYYENDEHDSNKNHKDDDTAQG